MNDEALISRAWPDWTVVQLIGQGTYGTVYHVRHGEMQALDAAVKIIPIPSDENEIASLRQQGFSDPQIADYFAQMAQDWQREILTMKKYQGMSHFVSMEDCKILNRPEGEIGQWILIRMEKLKSFISYISDKTLSEAEVIHLGRQLCGALAVCHADGVLHRDIKPDNIFVNDRSASGILYKLGDFGVAAKMKNVSATLSVKGALGYMAPEIIQGKPYDQRVDIYSLGLTLYKLMNGNRLPFLPAHKLFTHEDHAVALRMRLSGMPLPPAANASPGLNQVLSRACAFDPSQRYASAQDFSRALEGALTGKPPKGDSLFARLKKKGLRRVLLWLGVGLLAGALLLGGLKMLSSSRRESALRPLETEIPMLTVIQRNDP